MNRFQTLLSILYARRYNTAAAVAAAKTHGGAVQVEAIKPELKARLVSPLETKM
jgi:hypothetical protein